MDRVRIVISGNIFDGFRFFGPFDNFEDACDFGEGSSEFEWYVASLEHPVVAFDETKDSGYYWSDAAKKVIEEMRKNSEL